MDFHLTTSASTFRVFRSTGNKTAHKLSTNCVCTACYKLLKQIFETSSYQLETSFIRLTRLVTGLFQQD